MWGKRFLFRYVSRGEWHSICKRGYVLSRSGMTYFTAEWYEDAAEAQAKLSLPERPEFRVGAIPWDWLPDEMVCEGLASPKYGQPGGGHELAVRGRTFVFQIVSLNSMGERDD
jgi:hypothetical protein